MSREYHPHINESGATECAYAGCGKEVPADHYLCLHHYKKYQDGLAGPCPSEGCARFRSLDYERCADCGKAAADRELELKRLVLRNRRAALALVFQFQDSVRLVSPLLQPENR